MSIGNSPPGDPAPSGRRPSIGRSLAQARITAGLTVEEVSNRTRVRSPIVQAIEQDDFSRSGGAFYARGHIRLLAKAVGIDPETLVARYDAEHGTPVSIPPRQIFEADKARLERRRPNWTAAMVAAIAVVIAFVGFNLFSAGKSGGHPIAGKPTAARSGGDKSSGRPKPAPSNSAIAAVPADKVTVKLTAVDGKCWISAIGSSGETLFQNVLNKGDSKTFTDDKQIRLVVGNAGAVKMFVNGKDLGPAGDKGEVVRLNFTPGDPEAG